MERGLGFHKYFPHVFLPVEWIISRSENCRAFNNDLCFDFCATDRTMETF